MIDCAPIFPETTPMEYDAEFIFVADFTNRTNSQRGNEIHTLLPDCPKNPSQKMDVLTLHNTHKIKLEFGVFVDATFKIMHPEGWFNPTQDKASSFLAFFEIKDCKASRTGRYKKEAIEKYDKLYHNHIKTHYSNAQNLYYIVSFPRKQKPYNDYYFDSVEKLQFKKTYKSNILCTNDVLIQSEQKLTAIDTP